LMIGFVVRDSSYSLPYSKPYTCTDYPLLFVF
jgi:hypothetical protein